jgi:hypothetical protein
MSECADYGPKSARDTEYEFRIVGLKDGSVEPQVKVEDDDGTSKTWEPLDRNGRVVWRGSCLLAGLAGRQSMALHEAYAAIMRCQAGGPPAKVDVLPYVPGDVRVHELVQQLLGMDPDAPVVSFDSLGYPMPPRVEALAHDSHRCYRKDSAVTIVPDGNAADAVLFFHKEGGPDLMTAALRMVAADLGRD